MAEWCIFYQDGSTYDADQGDPASAPGWGVVVIAQIYNGEPGDGAGRLHRLRSGQNDPLVEGQDWYIFRDGVWFSVNLMGLVQYFIDPGVKIVKMGRWVHPDDFHAIIDRAQAWTWAQEASTAEET